MSGDLECSIDYLINEAMRQYALSRNYGPRPSQHSSVAPEMGGNAIPPLGVLPVDPGHAAPIPPDGRQSSDRFGQDDRYGQYDAIEPGYGGSSPALAGPNRAEHLARESYGAGAYGAGGYGRADYGAPIGSDSQMAPPLPPRPPSSVPSPGPGYGERSSYGGYGEGSTYPLPQTNAPPPGGFSRPPPLNGGHHKGPPMQSPGIDANLQREPHFGHERESALDGSQQNLFVIFNGQKIPITKEEFIIGRGSKTADLPIKDGNISRRHAAIVFQEGQWYIRDLGSTNGVEFSGHRIDSKRVNEGDIFQLCDYELRFTYR
ncbi:MAG: FHA domain-containing protein [Myxococcota bacterium]